MSTNKHDAGAFSVENGEATELDLRGQKRALELLALEYGVHVNLRSIKGEWTIVKAYGHRLARMPILGPDLESAKQSLIKWCEKQ